MRNVADLFTEEARDELQKQLGIELLNDYEYSEEELEALYEQISDDFPYEFDGAGEPLRMGTIFEGIIDVFVKNKLVRFD